MPPGHDRRAGGSQCDVNPAAGSEATELTPSAKPTGPRTPTANGPIFKVISGARSPIAVASANAS